MNREVLDITLNSREIAIIHNLFSEGKDIAEYFYSNYTGEDLDLGIFRIKGKDLKEYSNDFILAVIGLKGNLRLHFEVDLSSFHDYKHIPEVKRSLVSVVNSINNAEVRRKGSPIQYSESEIVNLFFEMFYTWSTSSPLKNPNTLLAEAFKSNPSYRKSVYLKNLYRIWNHAWGFGQFRDIPVNLKRYFQELLQS